MANDIVPLKLDQANNRLCELEAGTDCIDPQFVEDDPNVAIAQAAADAAQATADGNATDIATLQSEQSVQDTAIADNAALAASNTGAIGVVSAGLAATDSNLAAIVSEQVTQNTDISDIRADNAAQDAVIADNTAARHDAVSLGAGSDPALDLTDQVITLDLDTAIAAYLDRSSESVAGPNINTVANTFITYATLNFTALHDASYRLAVSYIWSHDSAANDFRAQFLLDGAVMWEHRQEPKDSAGADGGTGAATDQRHLSHYEEVVTLTAGAHTLVLQFAPSAGGVESTIFEADITSERYI